jgi:hypothetical protein
MKRIVLFALLLLFIATGTLAQEVQLPYPAATSLSYEKGKIYYNGERVSKRDCQTILKLNAEQDLYKRYRSGLRMYAAGWSMLGVGLAVDAAFVTYSTIAIYYWTQSYDPQRPTMGPAMLLFIGAATALPVFVFLEVPAIPLICVGKKRMRESIAAYNISLSESPTAQNYWSIQPTTNGIGLVYNF